MTLRSRPRPGGCSGSPAMASVGRSALVPRVRPVGLSGPDGDPSVAHCPGEVVADVHVARGSGASGSVAAGSMPWPARPWVSSCWPVVRSAERTGAPQVPVGAPSDWLDRTYTVTCDGIVPGASAPTSSTGRARVAADGSHPPYFEHYDVKVTATVSGDVDGDAAPDAVVLLQCSPQPSNYFVQEVQLFSSTGGSPGLPSQPAHPAGGRTAAAGVRHGWAVGPAWRDHLGDDGVRAGRLPCQRPLRAPHRALALRRPGLRARVAREAPARRG